MIALKLQQRFLLLLQTQTSAGGIPGVTPYSYFYIIARTRVQVFYIAEINLEYIVKSNIYLLGVGVVPHVVHKSRSVPHGSRITDITIVSQVPASSHWSWSMVTGVAIVTNRSRVAHITIVSHVSSCK